MHENTRTAVTRIGCFAFLALAAPKLTKAKRGSHQKEDSPMITCDDGQNRPGRMQPWPNWPSIHAKRSTRVPEGENVTSGVVAATASDYLHAGIVVIPLRLDGSKAPAIRHWKRWQTACPTPWLVADWFSNVGGIGIVCGTASGGLEVLDFDCPEVFAAWLSKIPKELRRRLVVVRTGRGGFQVYYRCREIAGNTKIASWETKRSDAIKASRRKRASIYPVISNECTDRPDQDVRIETRGEGGYVVGVGSPAAVHSSGREYEQIHGPPLPNVNTITPAERAELWRAAASFDCRPPRSYRVEQRVKELKRQRWEQRQASRPSQAGVPPWDDFDRRGCWAAILEPHGWHSVDGVHWTRPGKQFGTSAKVSSNDEGLEILTVFSSNAGILGAGVGAGPFASWGKTRALTALNHNGDSSAAAKALHAKGYGSWKGTA